MAYTKTSFICLLLMIYMGCFHFSRKQLPIKSAKLFNAYFFTATIVTLFDFITLITVNRMDVVPWSLNTFLHTIYILSINLMMFFLYLYVQALLKRDLVLSKFVLRLQTLPMLITSVMITVLPIKYIQGVYTNYSSGLKVYSLYLAVIFYNIMLLYYGLRYTKELEREKRVAIIATVPFFIIVSSISLLFPDFLIVVLYVTLSASGLIMTGENPEKYVDKLTGMFNSYALEIVATDFIEYKKYRVATIFTISESDYLNPVIDRKTSLDVMKKIQMFSIKEFGKQLYRVGDNGFILLESSKAKCNDSAKKIITHSETIFPNYSLQYDLLSLAQYDSSEKFLSDIVTYCMESLNRAASYDILTGIRNRNSFERIITSLRNENIDAYYLIADVNNLKQTNDILGHSAGDKLLQLVANVFQDSVKDHGWVFRLGGDEFVILLKDMDLTTLFENLEINKKIYSKETLFPISYAIGYGKILDPDGIEIADKMMYENKAKMKQKMDLL